MVSRRALLASAPAAMALPTIALASSHPADSPNAWERANYHSEGLFDALEDISAGKQRWSCTVDPSGDHSGVWFTNLNARAQARLQAVENDPMLCAVRRKQELEAIVNQRDNGMSEDENERMIEEACDAVIGVEATTIEGVKAALDDLERELVGTYLHTDPNDHVMALLRGARAGLDALRVS